uniref:Glutaredoxin-2, mitochondrial n=1 Tax=Podarcis muralis TaxID=64176 RepID=A0A670IJ23_PODMU
MVEISTTVRNSPNRVGLCAFFLYLKAVTPQLNKNHLSYGGSPPPIAQGGKMVQILDLIFSSKKAPKDYRTISDNCVVIFSKTTCSYCNMAKKLFEDMNVNYTAIELDMYENGSQFQDILHQMTGGRTVPRIFINGTFVGGATDTQRLHREGKLLPLVHQCLFRNNNHNKNVQ